MNINELHKLKSHFVTREVGNELILVPLTGNVAKMDEIFTMNETARIIWEKAGENTTIEQMEELITKSFEIDKETARKDIEVFLEHIESTIGSHSL